MWKRFGIYFFVSVASMGLAADKPQTTVRESAEVSLVEVPVNVIGRDGKPVSGLSSSDFEVQDDGARQTILSMDVIDLKRKGETTGSSEPIAPAGRRHFLLLFDLSFSQPNQIVRAREAAVRFLESAMDPDDLAAVAISSVDRGARLLVTFTSDRRQLVAAIHSIGLPRAEEPKIDPLLFAFAIPGDPTLTTLGHSPSGESARGGSQAGANVLDPSLARVFTVMAQRADDQFAINRVERHLSEVDALAFALNIVEGRKTIIYFSEGFNGRLLFGSLVRERSQQDVQAENDAILNGRFAEVDLEHRSANPPLQRHLEDTLSLLRRSDCTVYPIDLAGLKLTSDPNLGPDVHGEDALFAFANGTGGEVLKNTNDFEGQMRRIAEKTSLTYVLAFRPTKKSGQGAVHRLKGHVKVKGAQVSARAGYYETRLFRALNPLERSLSAADVITHEKKGGSFPMELLAIALQGKPLARVPVIVEVPGEELLRGVSGQSLRLGLYVYAVTEGGEVADFFTRSVALDLAKEGAHLRAGAFRYCGSLRLLPGRYRLRAFVRDEDRGRFSFRIASLEVPDAANAGVRALPPLFFESGGASGVSVSEPAGKETSRAADLFELAGEGFLPQLRPGIAVGKVTRLCLMLYPRAGAAGDPFQIDARVRDAQGRAFAPARFVVLGRSSPDSTGLLKLLVEFIPLSLPPGDYSLSVTVSDPRDLNSPAQAEAPFRIL
jgi:VWFA-related protein